MLRISEKVTKNTPLSMIEKEVMDAMTWAWLLLLVVLLEPLGELFVVIDIFAWSLKHHKEWCSKNHSDTEWLCYVFDVAAEITEERRKRS